MGLSVEQTPEVPTQHLGEPLALITRKCSRSAEAVFAVMPSQLLVEAADPFLLLSDTVSSICRLAHTHAPDFTKQHLLQVRHVCAGTAARTMAQAIIHPIDTIKTRLQASA